MTEPALIADAHNHLDALSDAELERALDDATEAGVGLMVTVGMDRETSGKGLSIAASHEPVFAAVGLHPWMVQDHPDGAPIEQLRAMALDPNVVAIGEIGLDFVDNIWRRLSYRDPELRRIQEKVLRQQLRLAKELGLGVILHSRGAHEAITRILSEEEMQTVGGCIQFQDGNPDDVARYVELGFSFTIGSSVTYPDPGGWHDAVRAIPDDALLLESDAPWLPHSGKESERGAPADVALIGEHVAEIRGADPAQLFAASVTNLRRALPGIDAAG
jgi:TatD DNase family protein